jgi:dynamin 1-like protein
MEQLIPIANKLQDVLGAVGQNTTTIDLPQIVVVGGQSSGKSSVLESIVGRSFLPRGTGIVTRRPLILQLYNTNASSINGSSTSSTSTSSSSTRVKSSNAGMSSSSSDGNNDKRDDGASSDEQQEWGEFLHQRGRKYYDFAQIRQEIIAETDRLTGRNKGIDTQPIHLKIYSPRVLALTLVDLPGIAKVPVGDQPPDIEYQIRKMVLQYISNPNAIILAVTSANTDLANSDAIQLAQQVDPTGTRTVGVLTKLDLMDPGTDCADILMNLVIPLRQGYVAVVNRGQKDIDADKSIRDGLRKEEHFFKKHPIYSRDSNLLAKCGTSRLAKTLNNILMHHIRDCLPDLKSRIGTMLSDVQREMDALGSSAPLPNNRSARGAALLKILSKFATNFGSLLDGKGCKDLDMSKKSTFIGTGSSAIATELEGGARISYIFTDIFASSLVSVGAFDALTDDEIRATIRNANGTRPALFVPEISFDLLVRRQIARLEQPGVQCVDLVYEELQRIALQSQPNELKRYPVLRDRILEVTAALLRKSLIPTQMMISNLVKIELAYINTSHPDFIGGSRAVAKLMERIGQDNDRERSRQAKLIAQTTGTTSIETNMINDITGSSPLLSSSSYNAGKVLNTIGNIENEAPVVLTEQYENQNNVNSGIFNYIFRPNVPIDDTTSNNKLSPTRKSSKVPVHNNEKRRESVGAPTNVVHLPSVPDKMNQSTSLPPTDRERVEMEVIKSLVESYFIIIRKNFIDMVPKTIMYFLVNHTRDTMQNDLVSELYRDDEIGHLLKEADDIAIRRQNCNEMKELLTSALDIVNEVRDYNSFK